MRLKPVVEFTMYLFCVYNPLYSIDELIQQCLEFKTSGVAMLKITVFQTASHLWKQSDCVYVSLRCNLGAL